jgi:putative ABC transport system permease protein
MDTVIRGMRNVLRNPMRLLMVVLLLGASLMLVAAMVSLNGSAQQQLANVHKEVGTAITINYVTNDSQSAASSTGSQGQTTGGSGQNGGGGFGGGGRGFFTQPTSTPIPNSTITTVQKLPGVASVEESLRRTDTSSTLKTSSFQSPSGRSFSIPPTVNGISTDAAHFTLAGGSTPTLQSGRSFQASDANSDVAMMSQSLATTNSLTVGSTFTLKGKTFSIIGLYTTDQTFANSSLVVPLAVMQSIFAVNGVDAITAYAQSYEQVDTVAARVRTALGKAFDVVTEASTYASTISALNTAQNSIQLALIVSIITATLVIIFAVFITVHERTAEIGALKAIGASHWQVIRQFWGEVLALSAAAAVIAVLLLAILGPVISQAFNVSTPAATTTTAQGGFRGGQFGAGRNLFASPQATQLNVHLSSATLNAQTLLIIVGLGMGLAVLTSVIPSWYVAHIKPAEVLRRG